MFGKILYDEKDILSEIKECRPPHRQKKRQRFSQLSQLRWANKRKRNSGNTLVDYLTYRKVAYTTTDMQCLAQHVYSTPSNLIFVIIDEMMSTTSDERPDENSSNLQDTASTPPGGSLNMWDELFREPESGDGVSNPGSSRDNGVSIDSLHDAVSNAGSPHDVVSDVSSLQNVSSSSGSPHEVSCSSGSDTIT